jgi:hypothetical protein
MAPGIKYVDKTPWLSIIPFLFKNGFANDVEIEQIIPVKNQTANAAPVFKVRLDSILQKFNHGISQPANMKRFYK